MDQYKRIDGELYMKIYVVGDLHGCHDRLELELENIGFDFEADLLISVGDLIDRGPQSLDCLDLLNAPWFRAVRGNHEDMAVLALTGAENAARNWIANGGNWFYLLDPDKQHLARTLIRKAEKLPLVIEVNTANSLVVVCHADYPSDQYEYGKQLNPYGVIWSRERYARSADGEHKQIAGADAFYFGHTPVMKAARAANQHYIDTGAVFGNKLTVVQIQ